MSCFHQHLLIAASWSSFCLIRPGTWYEFTALMWDAFLLTIDVKRYKGYWSCCHHPLNSNQAVHSPLTSFKPEYWMYIALFSVNYWLLWHTIVCENHRRSVILGLSGTNHHHDVLVEVAEITFSSSVWFIIIVIISSVWYYVFLRSDKQSRRS